MVINGLLITVVIEKHTRMNESGVPLVFLYKTGAALKDSYSKIQDIVKVFFFLNEQ